jgi:RNA polymerase sigma-70 factor (ECF subfamily)
LAEDAVQEALIGAFSGQAGFSGKASFKTWTLGILKHKINDVLRTRCTQSEISLEYPHGEGVDVADLLNTTRPGGPSSQAACHPYHEPEQALSAGQFWTTFENALLDLPGMQADVFVKHELSALGIDEICGEMAISEGNFYVLMHRARKQLRSSMGHCRSVE